MPDTRENKEREERIGMEILVDAHTPEEQDLAWHAYLSDTLQFPFSARCTTFRLISLLEIGKKVEVVEVAPEEECNSEIFVVIRWQKRELGVPRRIVVYTRFNRVVKRNKRTDQYSHRRESDRWPVKKLL